MPYINTYISQVKKRTNQPRHATEMVTWQVAAEIIPSY